MKKFITLFLFLGISVFGQTTLNWRDENTTLSGSWNVEVHWWNGTTTQLPPGNEILRFNNNRQISMTNDLSTTNRYQIWFDGGASTARTITGATESTENTFSGSGSKIENQSSATHIIDFKIKLLSNSLEINPVNGDLTFSKAIDNNGFSIITYSGNGKKLRLAGVVSGTGGISVLSNAILEIAAAHTYSGTTAIDFGSLSVSTSGSIANSDVTLASGTSLNLNNNNTSVKSVGEKANSNGGTINLGSGTLTVNGGFTGTKYQNSISGSGNVVKNGSGILNLYGSQGFTGSLTINGGTLETQVGLSASVVNLNTGGTFKLINNVSINELNYNGGTFDPNSKVLTASKLTLQNGTSYSFPNSNISTSSVEVMSGATLNVTSNHTLTTLTLNSGSTLNISGGTLSVTNLVINDGTFAYPLPTGLTATNITVKNIATFNINSNFSFGSLTVESGSTANVTSATLTMSGNLTNNGTLNLNGNKVIFTGGNTVSGTVGFTDVDISGAVDFGANSTINGTLDVKSGGYVASGNAPIYAATSTLKYSSGGTYDRFAEWFSSGGKGLPYNVQISNNTTLNLGANGGTTEARSISGNLTIDAGSALDMSAGNEMLRPLTVLGNITIEGTLKLGGLSFPNAGDLVVKGNFTNNGSFNCNNREVVFQGTSNQTISGTQPITFDYFAMDNSNGVTLNRAVTIDDRLRMEQGKLVLGSNTLTLNSGATISGATLSNTNMIVATGTGVVRKNLADGTGSLAEFTFPIGDASNYSPVSITMNSGTRSSAYIQANLKNESHPEKNDTYGLYLNRYWTVSQSGITSPNYNIVITYVDADVSVIGRESELQLGKWDGQVWTKPSSTLNTTANTLTSNNLTSFSDFTGGEAGSLPVELTSFNAAIRNGMVDLKWETKTEINNYGFEVERKSAFADWTKIGFVEGHGSTNSPKYYSFSDKPSGTGKFSYRLKQIDNDGQFEYSPVVEILVDNLPNGYVLEQNYPNPFNPETSIRFALKEDTKASLKVFNAMGEEVATLFDGIAEAGRYYDVKFSGNELSSGFYIYKLVAGDHVSVKKMLLMK